MNVDSSTIHNSQELETTQMSLKRWKDKQNAISPYSGILFCHKKKVLMHDATWMNLENVMLRKEGSHKDHMLYDSICMKSPEEANLSDRKQISGCLGLRKVGSDSKEVQDFCVDNNIPTIECSKSYTYL